MFSNTSPGPLAGPRGGGGAWASVYHSRGQRTCCAPSSSAITVGQAFTSALIIGASAAGTATFGFLTNANQVGWIRMNLAGTGGAISYLAAAFNNTPGGTIHSGATAPEPSTAALLAGIGLLAMGAPGIRRLRKRREKDAAIAGEATA